MSQGVEQVREHMPTKLVCQHNKEVFLYLQKVFPEVSFGEIGVVYKANLHQICIWRRSKSFEFFGAMGKASQRSKVLTQNDIYQADTTRQAFRWHFHKFSTTFSSQWAKNNPRPHLLSLGVESSIFGPFLQRKGPLGSAQDFSSKASIQQ